MARMILKIKELSEKTNDILSYIEEEDFPEIIKDPEVYIYDESVQPPPEEILEAGARLYASERKFIFKGEISDGRIIFIAGDKESEIRSWLEGWIPEESEDEDEDYESSAA